MWRKTKIRGAKATKGERIEEKVARAKKLGEPIKDVAEIIYTPRSAGVIYDHDPRADKWELKAMSKMTIDVDKLDKRNELMNIAKGLNPDGTEMTKN